jgi:hypothetical protein
VDQDAVLRSVGIDPDAGVDVAQMIPDAAYYQVLETIAVRIDDASDLPIRVGRSMTCGDYGAFGLARKTAPTLRGSLVGQSGTRGC